MQAVLKQNSRDNKELAMSVVKPAVHDFRDQLPEPYSWWNFCRLSEVLDVVNRHLEDRELPLVEGGGDLLDRFINLYPPNIVFVLLVFLGEDAIILSLDHRDSIPSISDHSTENIFVTYAWVKQVIAVIEGRGVVRVNAASNSYGVIGLCHDGSQVFV